MAEDRQKGIPIAGIGKLKVIVNNPVPEKAKSADLAFEDTMFLLEMVKFQKEKEYQALKDKRIREMALQQKRKQTEKEERSIRSNWHL